MPPKEKKMPFRFRPNYLAAFFKSIVVLGIIGKERFHYWRLLFWTIFRRPSLFPQAITLSIYGYHFRKVFEKQARSMNVEETKRGIRSMHKTHDRTIGSNEEAQ